MKFTRRYECPDKNNKYYVQKSQGGWNPGLVKPSGSKLIFQNCVFYAIGRFNEIAGAGSCKWLASVNAENMVTVAKSQGLTITQVPTLGGCMVWEGIGSAAGHVAIVEEINGSGIITSESGWNASKAWWTQARSGSNWGQNATYKYLGCIQNPAYPFDTEPGHIYRAQVGAFTSYENAKRYAAELNAKGIECFIVKG